MYVVCAISKRAVNATGLNSVLSDLFYMVRERAVKYSFRYIAQFNVIRKQPDEEEKIKKKKQQTVSNILHRFFVIARAFDHNFLCVLLLLMIMFRWPNIFILVLTTRLETFSLMNLFVNLSICIYRMSVFADLFFYFSSYSFVLFMCKILRR